MHTPCFFRFSLHPTRVGNTENTSVSTAQVPKSTHSFSKTENCRKAKPPNVFQVCKTGWDLIIPNHSIKGNWSFSIRDITKGLRNDHRLGIPTYGSLEHNHRLWAPLTNQKLRQSFDISWKQHLALWVSACAVFIWKLSIPTVWMGQLTQIWCAGGLRMHRALHPIQAGTAPPDKSLTGGGEGSLHLIHFHNS